MEPQRYYHLSRRPLAEGTLLNQGVYGERVRSLDFRAEHYLRYLREEIFEAVRRSEFPHRPSRFDCVFLYSDLAQARAFRAFMDHYHTYLYEVEIPETAKIYCAESALLLGQSGEAYEDILQQARWYWSEKQHPDSSSLEILAQGPIRVCRLISAATQLGHF